MFYPNQMPFGPPFADTISPFVTNLSNLWVPFGGALPASPAGQNPMPVLSSLSPRHRRNHRLYEPPDMGMGTRIMSRRARCAQPRTASSRFDAIREYP